MHNVRVDDDMPGTFERFKIGQAQCTSFAVAPWLGVKSRLLPELARMGLLVRIGSQPGSGEDVWQLAGFVRWAHVRQVAQVVRKGMPTR